MAGWRGILTQGLTKSARLTVTPSHGRQDLAEPDVQKTGKWQPIGLCASFQKRRSGSFVPSFQSRYCALRYGEEWQWLTAVVIGFVKFLYLNLRFVLESRSGEQLALTNATFHTRPTRLDRRLNWLRVVVGSEGWWYLTSGIHYSVAPGLIFQAFHLNKVRATAFAGLNFFVIGSWLFVYMTHELAV